MTKLNSSEGKSTKILILEAAFSFYENAMSKDFSMSELAQKVGLSKPAIYRHFKNKDAVIESMKTYFFDLVASKINEFNADKKNPDEDVDKEIVKSIVVFFVENPQLINYFICQVSLDSNFLSLMQSELLKRGTGETFNFPRSTENEIYARAHDYFIGISILFYIKVREKSLQKGEEAKDADYFAEHLYDFLKKGFRGFSNPGDDFYPAEISDERFSELDEICEIKSDYLPEEDKILKALASVIKKYTVNGVTIERIAGELGMAKSSLYFYFENKNQMLFSLVKKEISFLAAIGTENTAEAKNLSEYIYITMLTEINFFLIRSSLLSICGWLLQTSTEDSFSEEDDKPEINSFWAKKIGGLMEKIDLGFKTEPDVLKFWIGILPVAVTILKSQNDFDDEKIVKAVKYIFSFVQNGSEYKKIEKSSKGED